MTALAPLLKQRIAQTGPIAISEYMQTCLLHPKHGYYTTQAVFGQQGDFVTAPEISQMFGELLGLCLAQTWQDQGRPDRFILLELGPGRGTLMADILHATRTLNGFHAGAQIHLLEASPQLRALQKEKLQPFQPVWAEQVADLPNLPIFCIANEFFDALPIRQFQFEATGWHERLIGLKDGAFHIGLTSAPTHLPALDHRVGEVQIGDIVELNTGGQAIAKQLGHHIEAQGGAALLIDYGDWETLGDTLQAVYQHDITEFLSAPGLADLSAHVDFAALVSNLTCKHSRLTPQGVLLERLGITARAQALAKRLSGMALDQHIAAHKRLTHPAEMGNLFKAIALYPSTTHAPAGFTE
jgi:SAM-dependent MidA family methyltransferase